VAYRIVGVLIGEVSPLGGYLGLRFPRNAESSALIYRHIGCRTGSRQIPITFCLVHKAWGTLLLCAAVQFEHSSVLRQRNRQPTIDPQANARQQRGACIQRAVRKVGGGSCQPEFVLERLVRLEFRNGQTRPNKAFRVSYYEEIGLRHKCILGSYCLYM